MSGIEKAALGIVLALLFLVFIATSLEGGES